MPFEQARQSELILIAGANAWGTIPGATEFGYTHESDVTRRGAGSFGANGPRGMTEVYNGVSGNFSVEGSEGEDAINAIATMQSPTGFVTGDMSNRYPFFIVANAYQEDGVTPIRSHFVKTAKLSGAPKDVAGTAAKQFAFQALFGQDFAGKKVMVKEFPGAATPVTSLSLATDNAFAFDPVDATKFALLILRQSTSSKSVKVLAKTTDYTETATAITLISGLTTTEKAIVVWVKA